MIPKPSPALSITVLVGSAEPYSGKSAIVLGLSRWLQAKGISFRYIKPLATSLERMAEVPQGALPADAGGLLDDDAHLIGEMLRLPPADLIPSLAISPSMGRTTLSQLEYAMGHDPLPALQRDLEATTAQVTIMEGPGSLTEGFCLGLHLSALASRLKALVLLVHPWSGTESLESLLETSSRLQGRACGVVLNVVDPDAIQSLKRDLPPLLEHHQLQLLGVMPRSPLLRSVSVRELSQRLDAQVLCCPARLDLLVETLSIGAMNVNSAMQFFRRCRNMAVVTGADRTDIQLAALEASTQCLILTGASSPLPQLVSRCEELDVPILKVTRDTLTTVGVVERTFGHVRLHESVKASFALRLVGENCDFTPLLPHLQAATP